MTKRNNLLAVALATAVAVLAAQPASAQVAAARVAARSMPVIGSTPQVCAMQRGRIQGGALININGLDGDTLRILQLTDPQTLAARAASATISFEAFCNFPHRVRIESQNNGLWPTDGRISASTTSTAFAYALPYQARLTWGDTNGRLDANAKLRQISEQRIDVNHATAGDMLLRIEVTQGASNTGVNAPLLAGAYGDTLRIFLEPR
ncbi:MAG TPA: hypothetical protein VHG29_01775 [Novosphingobium sp.]|nr:hypothetical protein [Novosphingobium sp.]